MPSNAPPRRPEPAPAHGPATRAIDVRRYLGPRYWTTWLILGLVRAIALLPFPLQLRAGRLLGRIGYLTIRKHRRVARANIDICFPALSPAERERLVRDHFESLGMALMEMAFAWLATPAEICARIRIRGAEHLRAASGRGKGVILLSAHFTAMELTGPMLSFVGIPIHAVYRRNKKNALVDEVMGNGRGRFAAGMIDRNDIRRMVEVTKAGGAVFFTSDHLVKPSKRSFLVPFFGEPALTHSGLLDIARMSGAAVVPFLPLRIPGTDCYDICLLPALENFPSGDRMADMARVNALFEARIREDPCQYYWINKRFGKRPPPFPDVYARG